MVLGSVAIGGEGFIETLDLLSVKASAEENGIFTYSVTNGEATITDCDESASGEITIPSTLDGYSVTSIGKLAFSDCTGLTSVTIGNRVKSIGNYAFSDCTGLTSVTIPDSVTSIGDFAFLGCNALTSIIIPDSVISIGDSAFDYCTSLANVTIGAGVTSIDDYAFLNCNALTSIIIPDSVTSIGAFAFFDCTGLTSITIGNGVKSIGNYAFSDCINLTNITIPDSVTSIGNYAFYGLMNVAYSENMKAEGSPWGARVVNGYVEGDLVYKDSRKEELVFCRVNATGNVIISDSVTSIAEDAFAGCMFITSIFIPDGVTSIGDYAFMNCSSLKDVYYGGAEWQKDDITIGAVNYLLLTATWHYSHVHSYTETVTRQVACTEDGLMTYTCECGDTYTKAISRTGHDYAVTYEWSADGKTCSAKATCKHNASHVIFERPVSICNVKVQPTCEKKGTSTYTAAFESDMFSAQTNDVEDIPALGHDYIDHEAKAPTCEEIGWEAYQTCSRCDYTSYKEIPPTGHKDGDNDGKCDVCREIINADAYKAFLESQITLNIPGGTTVDYGTKAEITATADNLPEGYTVAIYDGDTVIAQSKPGESSATATTGELKNAVTLTVKVLDEDGKAVAEKSGEVTIGVGESIFANIKALLKEIFEIIAVLIKGVFEITVALVTVIF